MEDTQNQAWHPDVSRRPEYAGKKRRCYSPDDKVYIVEYDENGYVTKWYRPGEEPQNDTKVKFVTLENLKYFATVFKEALDARSKRTVQGLLMIIFALFIVAGTMVTLVAMQVSQLNQSLTELEQQIDETSEALDSFESSVSDSLEVLQGEINSLREALQDEINSLREEVSVLEEAVQ